MKHLDSHGRFRTAALSCLLLCFIPFGTAYAHAFGQRFDLPLPLEYYLTGAAGAVFFSFVLVALFASVPKKEKTGYPRLNLLNGGLGRCLTKPWLVVTIQILVVFLFLLTVTAGLLGPQNPQHNLIPTMLWIIWWIGLAYFSALVGDLWALINPWKILFSWADKLYSYLRPNHRGLSLNLSYPNWLGVWPACLLFLVFVWGELVWTSNAIPAHLSFALIGYSLLTWVGMFLFGQARWLQSGEAFSIAFGLLARFAPVELRVKQSSPHCKSHPDCVEQEDGVNCYDCFAHAAQNEREINLRPFGAGLLLGKKIPLSVMAFTIIILSTVTFDGFMGTPLWATILQALPDWRPLQPFLFRMEMMDIPRNTVLTTAGMIIFPALFAGLYLLFSWMMKIAAPISLRGAKLSTLEIGAFFVFSLVPIALAYHLAHYLSFLLTVGQMVIPLISDPFGLQWDLFGTANYRINIGIVGAKFVWYTSVAAIVLGHIIAVYLAHILALRALNDRRQALISQLPMLVLMLFYTTLSLWILAQPLA